MKVLVVNCFDTYNDRIDLVKKYFSLKNYKVSAINSDFQHINKRKVTETEKKKGEIYIKVLPYLKNISINRLISHIIFGYKAYKKIKEESPEILYVVMPPNILGYFASKYVKKNKNAVLILDVIDLWPETMPMKKKRYLPVNYLWRKIRDLSLKSAKVIITECDFYQSQLSYTGLDMETVYLAKERPSLKVEPSKLFSEDEVSICYLGSINHLIDMRSIILLLKEIKKYKKVKLHIIGSGESKKTFLGKLQTEEINYVDYGKVYDFKIKKEIIDQCYFGLNLMREEVCVGLTMKSIDYLMHGLPLINNIPGDSYKFVEVNKVGFNLLPENIEDIANKIAGIKEEELKIIRKNSLDLFESKFTPIAFNARLEEVLKRM